MSPRRTDKALTVCGGGRNANRSRQGRLLSVLTWVSLSLSGDRERIFLERSRDTSKCQ